MFNRSEIMKAAWTHYRSTLRSWIKEPFNRAKFAWCLKCAWLRAKEAQLPAKLQQAARIERQIELLRVKDGPHLYMAAKRRVLESQLAAIAG